jgi:transcriptional regulator with XRE-family HTH domain
MPTLGDKLRDLRSGRGLTLKQVAAQTGLSVSFLSLVERDKVSISVDHLELLARSYGVRMVHLFQGLEEATALVTRAAAIEESARRAGPGRSAFTLLGWRQGARMEPLVIQIGPGHGDPAFRTLDGEMLLHVLAGRVRLLSEKGEQVELGPGDSAYYPGFPGHRIVNASSVEPARILLVTTPPTTRRDDLVDGGRGFVLQSEV